jgi:hypothetical protein
MSKGDQFYTRREPFFDYSEAKISDSLLGTLHEDAATS